MTMTPYEKLKAHLNKHMYKRGRFTGTAPADASRRSRTHVRVYENRHSEAMCVRMYSTDLIRAYKDNTIYISTGGWFTNTTKQNLNDALRTFLGWGGVGNVTLFNYRQPMICVKSKTYRFYDGMEFTAEGQLLSPAWPFERKQTYRSGTAEFRKDITESGFKAVWPVLFATAEPPGNHWLDNPIRNIVTNECYAHHWPKIAGIYSRKFDDHKKAYQALVRECTRDMTEVVKTDVTVI